MVKIFRTDDRIIHEEEQIEPGVWVDMVNPTMTEGEEIAKEYKPVSYTHLRAHETF